MISTRRALQLLMLDVMKRREFERRMFTILQRYDCERKGSDATFSLSPIHTRDRQLLHEEDETPR
ncbi:MAG TPA: hypothetical protein VJ246_01745 [Patescibacteria group bacterium]|nr:hypothetical protein [Patescibacteria group bacterium]